MEEQIQIRFKLDLISKEYIKVEIPQNIPIDLSSDDIRFQFKVDVVFNLREDTISVTPFVRYKLKDSDILNANASFEYKVPELKSITSFNKDTGEIKQKADIVPTLVSASFSSLRGIVYFATKGGPLERYPVPLVGISVLVQNLGVSIIE